ncbi:Uu.00g123840.m01.CDS01 [Anthostomella pinea]|uniref:Uu.00g123840.m01.CDS01 n=1 Tax=Anthostomella pinea TaxID=933095 RepID=A0AAI8VIF4_9PEZI|nr:Uu.00g123840.m01.CDS01 [Anthostomella pinea]
MSDSDELNFNIDLDTEQIKTWRSILTLIVFVAANLVVLFPFNVIIPVPRLLSDAFFKSLRVLRIIPPRQPRIQRGSSNDHGDHDQQPGRARPWFVLPRFRVDFATGPFIADIFLLITGAIGRREIVQGIAGTDNINPYDIMIFFLSLAYIAISIDASGLIRWLAFKVLQKAGKVGHRLFFYLYTFFFLIGSVIGNDPIILSGTAFLAYMTRVSSNIVHPRAWIHTQFAVANIASALLVSSNPTNLVLAGAFGLRFVDYTKNMVVPVFATAIVLFPFLLYIVFADESLIPISIEMHDLPQEAKDRKPVNPNIPNARGKAEEVENQNADSKTGQLISLEEVLNPFLDKGGAAFGGFIMVATLVTVLSLNAAAQKNGEYPVFYVTLPAAVVMLCWDISSGWLHREETRRIARDGRREIQTARENREEGMELEERIITAVDEHALRLTRSPEAVEQTPRETNGDGTSEPGHSVADIDRESLIGADRISTRPTKPGFQSSTSPALLVSENGDGMTPVSTSPPGSSPTMFAPKDGQPLVDTVRDSDEKQALHGHDPKAAPQRKVDTASSGALDEEKLAPFRQDLRQRHERPTLISLVRDGYRWSQETFPTVTAVVSHLPFALLPFAFCMFILVQGLVNKGWVPVFAYGWDHWVVKTGTIGAIGGMGFLSVILCNFAGTNIGTTILLSRVIQAWIEIHRINGTHIGDRTKWATIYSMALGVNYGAFSVAFSASLAGLLWRDILARKHIRVRGLEFARVNLPIIAIAMVVGCTVLVGEVYIFRTDD